MRNKFILLGNALIFLLAAIALVSAEYVDTGALTQSVNDCGITNPLNTTNAVYTLTQNVTSNSTCFAIFGNNITLDGAGFAINFSANGTVAFGINISGHGTTIRNISILEGLSTGNSKRGIYLPTSSTTTNTTIISTSIKIIGTSSIGIYSTGSLRIGVINSSITVSSIGYAMQSISGGGTISIINSTFLNEHTQADGIGFRITGGSNHLIRNSIIQTTGGPALDLQGGSSYNNITILNSTIIKTLSSGSAAAITIGAISSNITMIDSILDSAGNNLFLSGSVRHGLWNFTNVSENGESPINISWTTGANGTISTMWRFRANVTDFFTKSGLEGANISMLAPSGAFQFSEIVPNTGITTSRILIEYTMNDSTGTGPSTQYFSNYTVNVTNMTYDAHTNSSINLTSNIFLAVSMFQTGSDANFPSFGDFSDNNASVVDSGTATFNATIGSTNGTVYLQINNTNYTASNLTANSYNVSINLTWGNYTYKWMTWGNGSNSHFGTSSDFSYTINKSDNAVPLITVISPNYTRYHEPSSIEFKILSNENLASCSFSLNNGITNYTMSINSTLNGANYTNSSLWPYYYASYNATFSCTDTFDNTNNSVVRKFEITNAGVCGNSIVEPGEVCDGNTLVGLNGLQCTNVSAGFTSGTLRCKSDCSNYNVAQCVAGGNTINADSCSRSDVQSAIDSASEGDTVIVPAGNCNWTHAGPLGAGAVSLTKNIILRGAGINRTNITSLNITGSNDVTLSVSTSNSPFMIEGFTFKGEGNASHIRISSGKNFRITNISNSLDGLQYNNPPRLIFTSTGNTFGLIDHIDYDNSAPGGGLLVRMEDATAHINGTNNPGWRRPLTLGTVNSVYVEDSFIYSNGTTTTNFGTDADNAGRIVFRHNNMTNVEFGSHGAQSSGGRGIFSFEIYNNTFTVNTSVFINQIWIRGGTGVVYNNNFVGSIISGNRFVADTPRAVVSYSTFDGYPGGPRCNTTSMNPWDGNEDGTGYPCLDQVGRSTGDPRDQILIPLYEWNNINHTGGDINLTIINSPSDLQIIKGRDYHDDAEMPGYVAYPYPHYLQNLDFSNISDTSSPAITLLAPINGTNISAAQTSFNATFTDDIQLANATLYVWNSTGDIVNQTTYTRTGTSNSTNTTFSFPHNGTFRWNYLAYDNSSNGAWGSSNFTINYTVIAESEDGDGGGAGGSSGGGGGGGGGGGASASSNSTASNSTAAGAGTGIEGSLAEGEQNTIGGGGEEGEEDPSEFIGAGDGGSIVSSIRDLLSSIRPSSRNYIVWGAVAVAALIAIVTVVLHGRMGARHVVRKSSKKNRNNRARK